MTIDRYKYYMLILIVLISIYSCKKEKIDGINNCCCPIIESPSPEVIPERFADIAANGFFVMQKYYTINGNSITLDSSFNHAFETIRGDVKVRYTDYPTFSSALLYYFVDSVKVNSIRFKDYIPGVFGVFLDTTNFNFSVPRHYQFYGDTSLFDIIDYIDNSPIPNYTGYALLPDSVEYNKDFFVNIGNRSNVRESSISITTVKYNPLYFEYISNSVNSFTIPTDNLPYDWSTDQVKIVLSLRNWSSIKIKNRDYYFVSEHIYRKN